MSEAKALHERQRHYDILHHRMRVSDLSQKDKMSWFDREMFQQSRSYLANPIMSCNAVDLSDSEYLAVLDAFARDEQEESDQAFLDVHGPFPKD